MRSTYAPELQVKQYVAEVTNGRGQTFRVFKTGRDSHYLFCATDGAGCDTGLHVPVAKRDLQREVARALANGCGLDLRPRTCRCGQWPIEEYGEVCPSPGCGGEA